MRKGVEGQPGATGLGAPAPVGEDLVVLAKDQGEDAGTGHDAGDRAERSSELSEKVRELHQTLGTLGTRELSQDRMAEIRDLLSDESGQRHERFLRVALSILRGDQLSGDAEF